jgi:hypothetical protein
MNNNSEENNDSTNYSLGFFLLLWGFTGFIAFIYSITCFGRSGSILQKLGGLLTSTFLGPFYFIYLYFGMKSNYCI